MKTGRKKGFIKLTVQFFNENRPHLLKDSIHAFFNQLKTALLTRVGADFSRPFKSSFKDNYDCGYMIDRHAIYQLQRL